MSGAQFREALRGYRRQAVDEFLEQVGDELNAGRYPTKLVMHARFPTALEGYNRRDVDHFLSDLIKSWPVSQSQSPRDSPVETAQKPASFERSDRKIKADECKLAWDRFPGLPGSHLRWCHKSWKSWSLVSLDGSVWATVQGLRGPNPGWVIARTGTINYRPRPTVSGEAGR